MLLTIIGLEGSAHVEAANELAVDGLINQRRFDEARGHLVKITDRVDECFILTSRSRIEAARGETEQALVCATDALSKVSSRSSRATLRKLGRALVSLGRLSDGLEILERLVIDGETGDDAHRFVDVAGRLGLHGKVLEFCARARLAGVFDDFLLQWELRLLDRYVPDTAIAVLQKIIELDEGNKVARLHLVDLALRLGKKDLAQRHGANLPSVRETNAEQGAAVVRALASLGRSAEAVAYAYDLLRLHFANHHAHRAFRDALLFRDRESASDIAAELVVDEVQAGVAVCLTEEGAAVPQWFVLEDSQIVASGVEDEIRADSPLGVKLLKKKVGDEVRLSEGPGLTRVATVRELLPKYTFRVRDVTARWQYRFPEHQEMWMVRVASSNGDEKPDFSALFEIAKEQARRQKQAETIYEEKLIPIRLFGEILGKSEMQAIGHLASAENLSLRSSYGSADEYFEATAAFQTAAEVVLDVSALSMLLMLEELDVLDSLGKKVVVTHSTMTAVRAFVEQARVHTRSAGTMGANSEGPILFVASPEGRQAVLDTALVFQRKVEEKCRVVGCPALADLEPTDRQQMEDGLGASALESALLGATAASVMWTDDLAAAVIARGKFGTKRVWTQAVLRWLNEQGILPNERYARASARLLGWKYTFTSTNPEVMRAAANQAEWQPERWPLKQTLEYLSLGTLPSEGAAQLSAMLVAHCYLDTTLADSRRTFLQSTAEALAKRTDAARTIVIFGSILGRTFGLNAVAEADAMRNFGAWQREYSRRIRS